MQSRWTKSSTRASDLVHSSFDRLQRWCSEGTGEVTGEDTAGDGSKQDTSDTNTCDDECYGRRSDDHDASNNRRAVVPSVFNALSQVSLPPAMTMAQ